MVQEIKIEELKTAEYNPRIMMEPGTPEWEKLKNSIENFGNVEPVVWNKRSGNVVGGHQRLAVLKSMGYTSIPCSVVDLDDKDEKLLNLALNKIKGKWDFNKLEDLLKGFDEEVAELTGFSADELSILLANNDDLEWWGDDVADDDYWEEQTETVGSYVVSLVFQDRWIADKWAEKEGYAVNIKKGTTTTVIRME